MLLKLKRGGKQRMENKGILRSFSAFEHLKLGKADNINSAFTTVPIQKSSILQKLWTPTSSLKLLHYFLYCFIHSFISKYTNYNTLYHFLFLFFFLFLISHCDFQISPTKPKPKPKGHKNDYYCFLKFTISRYL